MNEIDSKIREALKAEDAELLESWGGEQPLHEIVMETFLGKTKWLSFIGMVVMTIFLVLAVLAAVQFFQAVSTKWMILWASSFLFCVLTVGLIKVWYWLELNRHFVTREVKRLELQVALLDQNLRQTSSELSKEPS